MVIKRHYFGQNVIIFGVGVTIGVAMTMMAEERQPRDPVAE